MQVAVFFWLSARWFRVRTLFPHEEPVVKAVQVLSCLFDVVEETGSGWRFGTSTDASLRCDLIEGDGPTRMALQALRAGRLAPYGRTTHPVALTLNGFVDMVDL
jgi:hypothetical protein